MEIIGWLGAAFLLISFFYLTIFKKKGDDPFYLYGNLFGSVGLLLNAYHLNALPFVLVNSCWILITIISLIKKYRNGRTATS